ncbi:uncharacterized protein LOC124173179 isoform X1 [Ischnura elegans]|uniref:uncharacterized protein LOC124173179 isoform X1 n=1 Tax=Ischnura elegans TaxID=197161 RepID=UPI001ED86A65|nr:uncharacterized protein LOC124173179 isoform X1 [Ischnura elegans]
MKFQNYWRRVEVAGTVHKVAISAIICDAPARAFLKCVKGHTGFYGCERCCQRGVYLNSKVVFNECDAELRTDDTFKNRNQKDHHLANSPLENIQNFGMVSQFPLDFMQQVCLGVMRRLLLHWIKGSNSCRLSPRERLGISERLNSIRNLTPSEFNRIPRGLDTVERWKANEFRLFLLYTGPYAVSSYVKQKLYDHFMILHVAIRILCSNEMAVGHCEYAKQLLHSFVSAMTMNYGPDSVVYNIHNLIHTADDVKFMSAPLQDFSCFPFENMLGQIKRIIRTANNPLSQLTRRLAESNAMCLGEGSSGDLKVRRDPLTGKVFEVSNKEITLSTCKDKNAYVMLKDKRVLRIEEMHFSERDSQLSDLVLVGPVFKYYENYFIYPCESSKLSIFKAWDISASVDSVMFVNIYKKCFVIPKGNHFIVYPLLH